MVETTPFQMAVELFMMASEYLGWASTDQRMLASFLDCPRNIGTIPSKFQRLYYTESFISYLVFSHYLLQR